MTERGIIAIPVLFGASVWLAVDALRRTRRMRRAQKWPGVSGRVVESIFLPKSKNQASSYIVSYEFYVDQTYESDTARIAGEWFWNNRLQQAFVDRFKRGQIVEVYYDPENPNINCLDRDDRSGLAALWLLALGALVLGGVLTWMWITDN